MSNLKTQWVRYRSQMDHHNAEWMYRLLYYDFENEDPFTLEDAKNDLSLEEKGRHDMAYVRHVEIEEIQLEDIPEDWVRNQIMLSRAEISRLSEYILIMLRYNL